jgi:hypothetical protein
MRAMTGEEFLKSLSASKASERSLSSEWPRRAPRIWTPSFWGQRGSADLGPSCRSALSSASCRCFRRRVAIMSIPSSLSTSRTQKIPQSSRSLGCCRPNGNCGLEAKFAGLAKETGRTERTVRTARFFHRLGTRFHRLTLRRAAFGCQCPFVGHSRYGQVRANRRSLRTLQRNTIARLSGYSIAVDDQTARVARRCG